MTTDRGRGRGGTTEMSGRKQQHRNKEFKKGKNLNRIIKNKATIDSSVNLSDCCCELEPP